MRRHTARCTLASAITWCILATTLVIQAQPVLAQAGSLELLVVDAEGKKIPLVRVTITDGSGTAVMQQTTTKKGKAEFGLNQAGTYLVKLEKTGFGTRTFPVEIRTGQVNALTTKMWDQATQDKQDAVAAFNQAIAMIQNKQGEPLLLLEKAAQLDPSLPDSHRLMAIIHAESGEIEAAGAALDTYLKLVPDGLSQIAPAAYPVFRARGQTEQLPAVREHLRAMGAHKDFATRVFNEGVAAVRAKEKEKALALFSEATLLDPDLIQAYKNSAAVHFNDREFAEALPYLKTMLDKQPQNLEALRLSFFAHVELGQTDQANARALAWRKVTPMASSSIMEQADRTFEENDTAKARVMVEAVLGADPQNGGAHYTMGRILAQKGSIAEAKEHLQKFLALDPNHPEAASAREMLAGL